MVRGREGYRWCEVGLGAKGGVGGGGCVKGDRWPFGGGSCGGYVLHWAVRGVMLELE